MELKILFIFIIKIVLITADWDLVFNDEFNGNIVDEKKWNIRKDPICSGAGRQCKPTHRLLNGNLVITANEDSNERVTLSRILSKEVFKFGKFEIRAALPVEKNQISSISLLPAIRTGPFPKDGQIVLFDHRNLNQLRTGIHYNDLSDLPSSVFMTKNVKRNLNEFHTYVFEWDESELRWTFDDRHYFIVNLANSFKDGSNPFDNKFRLGFDLRTTKQQTIEMDSFEYESVPKASTTCPLIIVDYVRVYRWTEKSSAQNRWDLPAEQNTTNVCNKMMPLIKQW